MKKWDYRTIDCMFLYGHSKGETYIIDGFCGNFEEFHEKFPVIYFNHGEYRNEY